MAAAAGGSGHAHHLQLHLPFRAAISASSDVEHVALVKVGPAPVMAGLHASNAATSTVATAAWTDGDGASPSLQRPVLGTIAPNSGAGNRAGMLSPIFEQPTSMRTPIGASGWVTVPAPASTHATSSAVRTVPPQYGASPDSESDAYTHGVGLPGAPPLMAVALANSSRGLLATVSSTVENDSPVARADSASPAADFTDASPAVTSTSSRQIGMGLIITSRPSLSPWTAERVRSHMKQQRLDIQGQHLTPTDLSTILVTASQLKITAMVLANVSMINKDYADSLRSGMACLPGLTAMSLAGCTFCDVSLNCLSTSLAALPGLTLLDLSKCHLQDQGLHTIAGGLTACTKLTTLCIADNGLQMAGGCSLGSCVSNWPALQELDFQHNRIGPAGARGLAEGLKNATALKKLYMRGNCIGPLGALAMGAGLQQLSHLVALSIGENHLGASGLCALGRALVDCAALRIVETGDNHFDHTSPVSARVLAMELRAIAADNRTLAAEVHPRFLAEVKHIRDVDACGIRYHTSTNFFSKYFQHRDEFRFWPTAVPDPATADEAQTSRLMVKGTFMSAPLTPVDKLNLTLSALCSAVDPFLHIAVLIVIYIPARDISWIVVSALITFVYAVYGCMQAVAMGRQDLIPWQLFGLAGVRETFAILSERDQEIDINTPARTSPPSGRLALQRVKSVQAIFGALPQTVLQLYVLVMTQSHPLLLVSLLISFVSLVHNVLAEDMATGLLGNMSATPAHTYVPPVAATDDDVSAIPRRSNCSHQLAGARQYVLRTFDISSQILLIVAIIAAFHYWVFVPFGLGVAFALFIITRRGSGSGGASGRLSLLVQALQLQFIAPAKPSLKRFWSERPDAVMQWIFIWSFRTVFFIVGMYFICTEAQSRVVSPLYTPFTYVVGGVTGFVVLNFVSFMVFEIFRPRDNVILPA